MKEYLYNSREEALDGLSPPTTTAQQAMAELLGSSSGGYEELIISLVSKGACQIHQDNANPVDKEILLQVG